MLRNYTYSPQFDSDDYLWWHVIEQSTKQIVASFIFEDDAQEYMEFLENGGGFAGFTPSFMTRQVSIPASNINEAFSAEFA